MRLLAQIPEYIIKSGFHLSVWLIERFHDMKPYEEKVKELAKLQEGTLGKDVATCLEKHNLRLVPGYESHDLKHVLLKYKMNPIDEIRMQAFMIGNGNISIPSLAIFLYGFILLPHKWIQLYKDFKLGLCSKKIKDWDLQTYSSFDTLSLRSGVIGIKNIEHIKFRIMNIFALLGSYAAMLFGGLAMLYCLPYLFSPVIEDLVGAGFPFVGGAILFSAGLICFTINNKKTLPKRAINK